MVDTSIISRSGKGAKLSSTDYDGNIDSFSGVVEHIDSDYTVVFSDQNKTLQVTGLRTITLDSIATIRSNLDTTNFRVFIKNSGTQAVTLTGAQLIDGNASVTISPDRGLMVQNSYDGSEWLLLGEVGHPDLGTMAFQDADSVAITGGDITGITNLATSDGGTGAGSPAGARTNLGLEIGTDVQAQNDNLNEISSLSPALDTFIVGTSGGGFRDEDAATARGSLGLKSLSILDNAFGVFGQNKIPAGSLSSGAASATIFTSGTVTVNAGELLVCWAFVNASETDSGNSEPAIPGLRINHNGVSNGSIDGYILSAPDTASRAIVTMANATRTGTITVELEAATPGDSWFNWTPGKFGYLVIR